MTARASVLGPIIVLGAAIALWWLAGTVWGIDSISTPPEMVTQATKDGWGFYFDHAVATFARAGQGFMWGNAITVVTAAFVLLIPGLEGYVVQVAVLGQCLPLVAIGPIVLIIFGGDAAAIFLAALLVSYTTLIAAIMGAQSASQSVLDLISAYGGGRIEQLRRVRIRSAIPSLMSALKIAIPGSVLGAIVGEYLGGISTGLGVAMNSAQYQMGIARLWNLAVVTVGLTLALYLLAEAIERRVLRDSLAGAR